MTVAPSRTCVLDEIPTASPLLTELTNSHDEQCIGTTVTIDLFTLLTVYYLVRPRNVFLIVLLSGV